MDETAESAGDSAEQLEGFSQRFAGAMGAAVAALAVGAAGLLSQVPVIGELFGGLSAIVQAVAFQMDGVLRPAMSGLTDTLFQISNAIFEADGSMGSLIGKLGALASGAGLVAGALLALGVSLTGPVGIAIAAITAAIAGLVVAWETNFGNIRGVTMNAINAISARFSSFIAEVRPPMMRFLNWLSGMWEKHGDTVMSVVNFAFRTIAAMIVGAVDTILTTIQLVIQLLDGDFAGAWETITNYIGRMVSRWGPLVSKAAGAVKDILIGLAKNAYQWGVDILNGILSGLGSLVITSAEETTTFATDLTEWASGLAEDAYQWGVDIMGVDGLGSLVDTVVDGFTSVSRGLIDWASSLADAAYDWGVGLIERFINGLKDTLSGAGDFLGEISAATGIDIPDVSATTTATVIGGAVGGGAGATLANTAAGAFARSGRSGDGGTTIDGRQITESTGRYRSDPARRQGL